MTIFSDGRVQRETERRMTSRPVHSAGPQAMTLSVQRHEAVRSLWDAAVKREKANRITDAKERFRVIWLSMMTELRAETPAAERCWDMLERCAFDDAGRAS